MKDSRGAGALRSNFRGARNKTPNKERRIKGRRDRPPVYLIPLISIASSRRRAADLPENRPAEDNGPNCFFNDAVGEEAVGF